MRLLRRIRCLFTRHEWLVTVVGADDAVAEYDGHKTTWYQTIWVTNVHCKRCGAK